MIVITANVYTRTGERFEPIDVLVSKHDTFDKAHDAILRGINEHYAKCILQDVRVFNVD